MVLVAIGVALRARADLADRIAACPMDGCVIQLDPAAKYIETKPWNLRGRKNLSIRGNGQVVYFNLPTTDTPPVVIDATGAAGLHFDGWKMATANAGGKPEVGLLLARDPSQGMSGTHRFDRWQIQGWYHTAAVVSMASEMNVWVQCFLSNSHPDSVTFWTGRDNELSVKSQFGEFGVGSTNTCHDFIATGFGHYGAAWDANARGVVIQVGAGTHDLHLRGGTMSMPYRTSPGNAGGWAAIQIGTPRGKPAINILLDAVEWETTGARHAVVVAGRVDGLSVRDSLFQSVDEAILVPKGGAINDSVFEANRILVRSGAAGDGPVADSVAAIFGRAVGCRFDFRALTLVPLTRDGGVHAKHAIIVDPDAEFRDNEVHVRHKDDVRMTKTIMDENEVRIRKKE